MLDTATGIPAAEDTHSGNVGGIFRQFMLGLGGEGGDGDRWMRLMPPVSDAPSGDGEGGAAAKARADYNAMRSESVNKMKYNLFERKTLKRWGHMGAQLTPSLVHEAARGEFPYFDASGKGGGQCFFENAGGAQAPRSVISRVTEALTHRWRNNLGMLQKTRSRSAMLHILGFASRVPSCVCTRVRVRVL